MFPSSTEISLLVTLSFSPQIRVVLPVRIRVLLSHSECFSFLFEENYTLYRASFSQLDDQVFTIPRCHRHYSQRIKTRMISVNDSMRNMLTLVNNEQSMRLYYDALIRAIDQSVHLIRQRNSFLQIYLDTFNNKISELLEINEKV